MRNPTGRWWRPGVAGFVGVIIAVLWASAPAGAKQSTGPSPAPTVSSFAISPTEAGNDISASPLVLYNAGGTVTVTADVTNALTCTLSSTLGRFTDGSLTFSCSAGTVTVGLDLPANTGKRSVKYKFRMTVSGYKTVKAKPVVVTVSKLPPPPASSPSKSTPERSSLSEVSGGAGLSV